MRKKISHKDCVESKNSDPKMDNCAVDNDVDIIKPDVKPNDEACHDIFTKSVRSRKTLSSDPFSLYSDSDLCDSDDEASNEAYFPEDMELDIKSENGVAKNVKQIKKGNASDEDIETVERYDVFDMLSDPAPTGSKIMTSTPVRGSILDTQQSTSTNFFKTEIPQSSSSLFSTDYSQPELEELKLAQPPALRLIRDNQLRIRQFCKDILGHDLDSHYRKQVRKRMVENGLPASSLDNTPGAYHFAFGDNYNQNTCDICGRNFVHPSGLLRHMTKHQKNPLTNNPENGEQFHVIIKCLLCRRVFFEATVATDHLLSAHFPSCDEKEKAIEIASEGDDSSTDIDVHLNGAIARLEQLMSAEPQPNTEKGSEHLVSVVVESVLQCEWCDFLFTEATALLEHSACHLPERPFECFSCSIFTPTRKELTLHFQSECIYAAEMARVEKNIQHLFMCNVCECRFVSAEMLINHRYTAYHFFPRMSKLQEKLLYPCEFCNAPCSSAKEIIDHYQTEHSKYNTRNPYLASSRQHLCDICGKTYTQSSHLRQHLRFHQGIKPFVCNEPNCNRSYTIRADLNDHIRKSHTGERPYQCLVCGKRFLTGSVYYQHRLIHRGERRHECDVCKKRFYRTDALKNHRRIHTGEKPFGCQYCTKHFRQRGDCEKHMRARHSLLDANAKAMMRMQKYQLEKAATDAANKLCSEILRQHRPPQSIANSIAPINGAPLTNEVNAANKLCAEILRQHRPTQSTATSVATTTGAPINIEADAADKLCAEILRQHRPTQSTANSVATVTGASFTNEHLEISDDSENSLS